MLLTVGQQMTVHPTLELGSVSESIEVKGTPPPVTTFTSTVSQLVDTKRIEQLPLNGRNALQLVSLLPGVVPAGTAGQMGASGINMNPFYAIANEYPNPDALEEFSTSTRNYSAAFGRGDSAVTAVTRSAPMSCTAALLNSCATPTWTRACFSRRAAPFSNATNTGEQSAARS